MKTKVHTSGLFFLFSPVFSSNENSTDRFHGGFFHLTKFLVQDNISHLDAANFHDCLRQENERKKERKQNMEVRNRKDCRNYFHAILKIILLDACQTTFITELIKER